MRRALFAFVAVLALAGARPAAAQELLVYAAASLTDALQAAAQAAGTPARFSFAASSTLARQIENGAPADIFASADEEWADYLATRNLLVKDSRAAFLSNRLVLIVPADRPHMIDLRRGMDFGTLLGNGRLAMGDPAHVPVGRYAQQAFTWLDIWPAVAPRLARADSVRAAMVLVERGEVPFGVVYATDAATSPRVSIAATFPTESHVQIAYPFAIVAGRDRPVARAFLAAMRGTAATAAFHKAGFAVE